MEELASSEEKIAGPNLPSSILISAMNHQSLLKKLRNIVKRVAIMHTT